MQEYPDLCKHKKKFEAFLHKMYFSNRSRKQSINLPANQLW